MGTQRKSNGRLTKGTGKPRFLYRQLADLIRQDIDSGALAPGDMLPSMDALSAMYEINKATVRQAIAELIAGGMVYSVPAKGTFVSEGRDVEPKNGKRTFSIGWISAVTDKGNTGRYHTELMDAVRTAVQEAGGHLVVFSVEGANPSEFCKRVGEARLDGAIMVGPAREEPLRTLLNSGLPAVLIDDQFRGVKVHTIRVDNEAGGYQAIEHLTRLGHTSIALITGPRDWEVTRKRLAGAQAAMADASLDPESAIVIESDFSPQGGFAACMKLLKQKAMPTAIFSFNDEMCAGILQALYEHSKLRVPEDVSLVGFDDVFWAELTHPPLTTVHVEKGMIGREAVDHVIRIIESERNGMGKEAVKRMHRIIDRQEIPATSTLVPTRLEIRKSTTKPKQQG